MKGAMATRLNELRRAMSDVQERLSKSSLTADQWRQIRRLKDDKLCASSIAAHVACPVPDVESVLWRPRVPSAYEAFCTKMRAERQTELSGLAFVDQVRTLSQMWSRLPEAARQVWESENEQFKTEAGPLIAEWEHWLEEWYAVRNSGQGSETLEMQPSSRIRGATEEMLRQRLEECERQREQKKAKKEEATKRLKEETASSRADPLNQSLKQSIEESIRKRVTFYKKNWTLLSPFLPEHSRSMDSDFAKKLLAGASESLPTPEQKPVSQPQSIIHGKMYDYQIEGLQWMVSQHRQGVGGILGDEMGLGKTLQVISFLAYLMEQGLKGPYLVVAPLSVLPTWRQELERWFPSCKVAVFYGNAQARAKLKQQLLVPDSYDVILTTYETVVADIGWFGGSKYFQYLVLDEAQRIKNEACQIGQAVRRLKAAGKLLITGTPLQNDMHELWALLNFMFPDFFTTDCSYMFDAAFSKTIGAGQVFDCRLVYAAHALLQPLMLRRLKMHVQTTLPPKKVLLIWCPLSSMQRFWYRRLLLHSGQAESLLCRDDSSFESASREENAWKKLQSLMMQLRKACNHPYLFPGSETDDSVTDESIVRASSKMQVLDRLLEKLHGKSKVLLYSQFTSMLDICEDYMNLRGYRYRRLDGSTSLGRRQFDINLFNKKGSNVFVYLLSTRAGALGITLTGADTVIMLDSDWNPTWDKQAHDRAHRIGQTKPVTVYQLLIQGAVEERIYRRSQQKICLNEMVLRDHTTASADEGAEALSAKEIRSILQCGAKQILQTEGGGDIDKQQIDELIASAAEQGSLEDMDGLDDGMSEEELSKITSNDDIFDIRQLEGVKFDTKKGAFRSIADDWCQAVAGTKREAKSTLVKVNGHDVLRWSHEERHGISCKSKAQVPAKPPRFVEKDTYCLHCQQPGALLACSVIGCHRSVHAECNADWNGKIGVKCPQHACHLCGGQGSSGLMFRCLDCPLTFCEGCLPSEGFEAVDRYDMLQKLGYVPGKYEYIKCPQCLDPKAMLSYKIGARVEVHYEDGKWHSGTITKFLKKRRLFTISIEDGAEETLRLPHPDVRLMTATPSAASLDDSQRRKSSLAAAPQVAASESDATSPNAHSSLTPQTTKKQKLVARNLVKASPVRRLDAASGSSPAKSIKLSG